MSAARAIRRGAGCAGLISKYWAKAGPRTRPSVGHQSCQTGLRSAGSGGSRPRSTWLSSGPWKSEPREARKSSSRARRANVTYWSGEWLPVTTSMPSPPAALNSARKRRSAVVRQLVAPRVRDDRAAAARADPRHRVGEVRPLLRHVTRLPAHEVVPEHARYVARHAAVDQEAREVRAADQLRILGVAVRTLRASRGCPGRRTRRRSARPGVRGSHADAPGARRAPRSQGRCRDRRCGS